MDFNFKNKVVLIIGSSSGIGRGAAMAFAGKGAKVVLSSRNIVENKKLLDDIVRLGGHPSPWFPPKPSSILNQAGPASQYNRQFN